VFLLHTLSMCKLPWNYSFVSITLLEIMPPEQWQDFHDEILTAPQYYVGIGLYIYKIVYASLKHLYSI